MRTRNGIYYDLRKSTFKVKMKDTGIVFVFSSDLHATKFEEQVSQNREEFNIKHSVRFRVNLDFKVLPDILLYRKIETRGFLIISGEGQGLCLENLILDGEKVTRKN